MSKGGFARSALALAPRVAQSFFKINHSTQRLMTGRIHPFDIHYSIFDIRFFRVSFSIRPAVFLAGDWTDS